MNYVIVGFSTSAALIILLGTILNFFENKVPLLSGVFKYGKFGVKEKGGVFYKVVFDLPKSWFRHFYCVAVVVFTYTFYEATSVYIWKQEVPRYLFDFLDAATDVNRRAQISATHLYLAVCLMTLQVFRRFFDTHFVSVFGKNSYMNILHYGIGILHYPGVAIALLCEAPKFSNNTDFADSNIDLSKLTFIDYFATGLFLWAWWHQHTTTKILANLRKNKKGDVVTSEHKIPYGDWFEYLSSPPQTAEILMYTSISIILWYHITWFFVYVWVLTNQIESMILSHQWYVNNFKNYPKNRKALIPFVY